MKYKQVLNMAAAKLKQNQNWVKLKYDTKEQKSGTRNPGHET